MRTTEQTDPSGRSPGADEPDHILATAKGGGFLAAGALFEYGTRFLIGILLARGLGATGYGLYVLAVGVASLFAGISLLGTDDAMVRYVAILSSREDHDGIAGTLQIGLGTALIGGTFVGVLLFACAGPIANGLFSEPELQPVLRMLAVVVPFLAVSNTLLGIARGFKRMDITAFAQNGVQSVVRLVLVALLALTGWLSLYPAALAFGISDIAASLALIHLLNRTFPLRSALRRGLRRDLREVFAFALPLWLSGLLRQFRNNIQTLMLGAMSSAASVGVFSISARINEVATVGSRSVYVASRPLMAQLHDQDEHRALKGLYVATTRWTLAVNIPFFLVMILYPAAVLSLFGEDFVTGATALVLLAWGQMIGAATGTCQGLLDMTGHTRWKLANTICFTVLLIGGGAIAIPTWGITGAATAWMIAVATVNIATVVEVWVLERLQPYDRSIGKPLIAGAVAFAGGFALRTVIPVEGPLGAAVQGTLVGLAYLGMLLWFGLDPQDRLIVDRTFGKARGLLRRIRPAEAGVGAGAGEGG